MPWKFLERQYCMELLHNCIIYLIDLRGKHSSTFVIFPLLGWAGDLCVHLLAENSHFLLNLVFFSIQSNLKPNTMNFDVKKFLCVVRLKQQNSIIANSTTYLEIVASLISTAGQGVNLRPPLCPLSKKCRGVPWR